MHLHCTFQFLSLFKSNSGHDIRSDLCMASTSTDNHAESNRNERQPAAGQPDGGDFERLSSQINGLGLAESGFKWNMDAKEFVPKQTYYEQEPVGDLISVFFVLFVAVFLLVFLLLFLLSGPLGLGPFLRLVTLW